MFSTDIKKALGINEALKTVGWMTVYKILDKQTWELIKDGTLTMGSIEGSADLHEVAA